MTDPITRMKLGVKSFLLKGVNRYMGYVRAPMTTAIDSHEITNFLGVSLYFDISIEHS